MKFPRGKHLAIFHRFLGSCGDRLICITSGGEMFTVRDGLITRACYSSVFKSSDALFSTTYSIYPSPSAALKDMRKYEKKYNHSKAKLMGFI